MTDPSPKPPVSRFVRVTSNVFMVAGLGLYLVVFPDIFGPRTHDGFDWKRVMLAAGVGAGSAVVGALIGLLIERLRR